MRPIRSRLFALAAAGGLLAALLPAVAGPAFADQTAPVNNPASAIYVSTTGGGSGGSCNTAAYSSINDAITAASDGGTVIVCHGTYNEDVLINKSLSLLGRGATIDATDLENAVQIVRSNVVVKGFTLENANGEGVLVGIDSFADIGLLPPSGPVISDVTIQANRVINNNLGFNGTEAGNCKYPGDCGGGIHLNVTMHAVVRGNVVTGNVDGMLLTDDYGPNAYNLVEGNIVSDNIHECGITLPSHSTDAVTFDPTTYEVKGVNPALGGVYGNIIRDNVTDGNGTVQAPPEFGGGGSGAGIGIFASGPGSAAYDNLVENNEASGNGLAGITIHAHLPGGEDVSGNTIVGNTLGTNNILGDGFDGPPTMDFATTGIAVYPAAPGSMTISGNTIRENDIGIWVSTIIDAAGLNNNKFKKVTTPIVRG